MPFVQLRSSNALLDDQSALDRRYREEGALFFRAAIDPNVLRPIRDQVAGVLERWSVARWENDDLVWTGVPLPDFDRRELHDLPALNALSEANGDGSSPLKTLADAVYSRPTSVSRALTLFAIIPDDPAHTTSPHRDNISGGFANPERQDADYRRLWLPLTNIAFGDGGLAVALGSHGELSGTLVETTKEPWATASFELGDALFFHARTLHAGIPFKSHRIRIAVAPMIALEGHPHEFNRTVPESEDDRDECSRIAAALGASETDAGAAFRLLTLRGEIVPDQDSVAAALAAVRKGISYPPDFVWPTAARGRTRHTGP
jgi:hypothetical protein